MKMVSLQSLVSKVSHSAGENRYPVLSITAGIGFVKQTEKFGKEIAGAQYVHYTVLKKGDFSYNKGNSNTYPQGCIYRQDDYEYAAVPNVFNSFRFVSPDCDTTYYKYLFESGYLNRQLSQMINSGVRNDGLLNIYDEDFYGCKVPCPPLEEQKRIAEILECCDRVIRLKRELIEEKKKQKKSLMQKLIDPNSGFRLPGFKGEWISYKISQIAKIESGGTPSTSVPEYWDGGIMWCTPSDVTSCSKYLHNTERTITESGLNNSSAVLLPVGSIVMCSRASVGPHAIITVPLATNQAFKSFICSESLNNEFWYYYLDTIVKDFQRLAGGNTFKEVSKYAVENFEVRIPEYREQQAIASVLSSADHELDLLEQDLTQWEQKKKSLMQLLFTGKVKV